MRFSHGRSDHLLHCNVACHIPYCDAQARNAPSSGAELDDQEMIMSTTTTHFDPGVDLYEGTTPSVRYGKSFSQLRAIWEALGEGFAASKRYHELTARGLPHDQAASKVFLEHYQGR
jgi:hypothetical protein